MRYPLTFSPLWTLGVGFFLMSAMFVLQLISIYVGSALTHPHITDPATLIGLGSQNGSVVAYSVMVSGVVMVALCGLMVFFKSHRSLTHTLAFFDFRPFYLKGTIISILSLMGFMIISEIINWHTQKNHLSFLEILMDEHSTLPMMMAVVFFAPIYEEVLFRGLIFGSIYHQKYLSPRTKTLSAIIISGLLFSVIHLQYDIYGVLTIFILSILLGVVRLYYGLGMAILLHFLNNSVAMVAYLLGIF